MSDYTVLVSGPRGWPLEFGWFIRREFDTITAHARSVGRGRVLLLQGTAQGFDSVATLHAIAAGWNHLPHPADWRGPCDPTWCKPGHRRRNDTCPLAGHRRNQAMVDTRPDFAVVGLMTCTRDDCRNPHPHWTHGTEDCAARIEKAGIPVWYLRAADLTVTFTRDI